MTMRSTYTYAVLEVSESTYKEIAEKLKAAGYDHAFHTDSGGPVIDMHGIALQSAAPTPPKPKEHDWQFYANGTFCRRCGTRIGSGYPCR